MAIFKAKTREEILSHVADLLLTYEGEIGRGLDLCEKSLSVSFRIKIKPLDEANNEIDTSISFTKEKISDKVKTSVEEVRSTLYKGAN